MENVYTSKKNRVFFTCSPPAMFMLIPDLWILTAYTRKQKKTGSIPQTVLVWKISTYKKKLFYSYYSSVFHSLILNTLITVHLKMQSSPFSSCWNRLQICTCSCIKIVNNSKILLTAKFPFDDLLEKKASSLLFGELSLLLQHCSATLCHLSFLWAWFWCTNTDFLLTWSTWPLSCFSIIHPWAAWMIWTSLRWIWDDNNAGIVTVQREAARTLTLKD